MSTQVGSEVLQRCWRARLPGDSDLCCSYATCSNLLPPPSSILAEEVHVLPQLCIAHPVPAALWRPLATLPALMWQLEGALLAAQLLEQLLPAGLPADKWVPGGEAEAALQRLGRCLAAPLTIALSIHKPAPLAGATPTPHTGPLRWRSCAPR